MSKSWTAPEDAVARRAVACLLRVVILAVMLFLPTVLIFGAAFMWLRPQSRQYNLEWSEAPADPTAILSDIRTLQPTTVDNYRTPEIVRWYTALRAVRGKDAAAAFEKKLQAVDTAEWHTALKAKAAQKFAELGDRRSRDMLLQEIQSESKELKPVASSAVESAKTMGGLRTRKVKELAASLELTNATPLRNVIDRTIATEKDPARALRKLSQSLEFVNISPVDGDVLEHGVVSPASMLALAQYNDAPDTRFNTIQDILSISHYMSLVPNMVPKHTDRVLQCARELALLPMIAAKAQPYRKARVEALVLVAKGHRWPTNRRHYSFRLLQEALLEARREQSPNLRVHLESRVASGYARLGAFSLARELCRDATPRERYSVAREMLCNDLERTEGVVDNQGIHAARRMIGITWVFDEMLDSVRDRSEIQQMLPR